MKFIYHNILRRATSTTNSINKSLAHTSSRTVSHAHLTKVFTQEISTKHRQKVHRTHSPTAHTHTSTQPLRHESHSQHSTRSSQNIHVDTQRLAPPHLSTHTHTLLRSFTEDTSTHILRRNLNKDSLRTKLSSHTHTHSRHTSQHPCQKLF
ncbi:hypothetical protein TVAGG3_0640040 [Trichomonas vaginalis G3]|uniref:hypothetical protein n=1 Tax=Trichomonas vaginalis (strain ATCC PRA-98 / G3) TaxID=412133 RepID=UPI0021E54AAF|nr:hypothetical protein TVAGG3_0640040 [Trichomonas vaginalis G3]KAI5505097.1 hypothetical protein TVAGG3_0640040 [Trichomonas vaginalis G3]